MLRTQRAFAGAAICAVVAAGCGPHGGAAQQGPPPVAVEVAQAQRQDIGTSVDLDGQIAPLLNATLTTQQAGTVLAVDVNEGERVHAGEVLAKLDDSTFRAQLAQQQAIVVQSQAKLRSSTLQGQITPSQATSTVASARQQLQTARNSVQSAQAALSNETLIYNSNQKLYAQGFVAQTAYEQSHSDFVAAQQALNNANEQQRQAEAALRAAQAQGVNAVPIQDQQIAQDRATLVSAQAAVKLLQTQIAQTSLNAPFDGIVTQRLLDPGAYASPNQPVIQLSQIDRVYVNVNVPDADLAYVHRGTVVSFSTSSIPGRTFSGSITDVNAVPTQGTLSYRARIIEPNADDVLRGGMLVAVSVRKEFHPGAVVVPLSAVAQTASGANVFTVVELPAPKGGAGPAGPPGGPHFAQAKLVPVQLGVRTDVLAEVRSPEIRPGTTVIITRPDALQDKSLIAMSPPASASGSKAGTATTGAP
jgi:RND family efflux transporter MFP subunit